MEQKEKRLGKLNIIDLIAIVLVLLVAVYAAWRFVGRGKNTADVPMTKITYKVRAENRPAAVYENAKKHLPSPLMASGALVGGQILSVEKEPYYVLDGNGEWVEDPEHVTLIFTAETTTPTGEVMTSKVGEQEVRIGKTDYILKSEYVEISGGTIIDVVWES
ncbi:MAG: DUF4330 domain-containing protein [Oscillibacter sp.]|nr:DUF4330 domain-containing protein [Oscillibacter sp.]